MARVTIVHPVTGHTAEITESALGTVARSGWVLADDEGAPVEGWTAPSDSLIPDDEPPVEAPAADDAQVPDGTVHEILDWVGDDPARAQAALEAEQAKDTPRISLVEPLQALSDTNPESQED